MRISVNTILLTSLTMLIAVFTISTISCTGTKKPNCPACSNGGICKDGDCSCPPGYTGNTCETVTRDKFVGRWYVNEQYGTFKYPLDIIADTTNITNVLIKNFHNYFISIKGYITGDTLYIPNQQLAGRITYGKGYIHSKTIKGQYDSIFMTYAVVDTMTGFISDYGYLSSTSSFPSRWHR